MKRALIVVSTFIFVVTLQVSAALAVPTIDRNLTEQVNRAPLALTPVIIT